MRYDECPVYLKLYKELVPSWGPSDTIEGEALRGAAYIGYRWYNDGDLAEQEVVSKTIAFLNDVCFRKIDSQFSLRHFRDLLANVERASEDTMGDAITALVGYIVAEIERIGTDKLTNNRRDSVSG